MDWRAVELAGLAVIGGAADEDRARNESLQVSGRLHHLQELRISASDLLAHTADYEMR